MRKAWVRCALCVLGLAYTNAALGGESASALGYRLPMSFPTGGYWPWERLASAAQRAGADDKWQYARKLLPELKNERHWNTVWVLNIGTPDAQKFLQIAGEVGIWVVLEPSTVTHHFIWYSHASPEAIRKTAEKTVREFGRFDALAGYVFVDEPSTISMGFLEAMRREIKALDPTRACLTVTMLRDTAAAAHRTGLPLLVSDVYPFGYPRDPNLPNRPRASRAYYRAGAQFLGQLASATGKRPWIMPQIFQDVWGLWYYDDNQHVVAEKGAYLHWRMPTVGETRWQIWCAIAHNAKGVVFYVLFPPHNPRKKGEPQKRVQKPNPAWPRIAADLHTGEAQAMLHPDGAPSRQMLAASEVFRFIRRHADLLDRLEPLQPEIAYGCGPAFARTFRDSDTGSLYAVVYTDETDRASVAVVSFLCAIGSVQDIGSGKGLEVRKSAEGFAQVELPLPPGGGALLALKAKKPGAPLLVATEDFSLTTIMASMDNAKRAILRRPFGLGWEHCIISDPGTTQPAVPGTVTCQLLGTGAHSRRAAIAAYPKDAAVFVAYKGLLAGSDPESLILEASKDGEHFSWAATGMPELPVEIANDVKAVRFRIKPGARLSRFDLIAVPRSAD